MTYNIAIMVQNIIQWYSVRTLAIFLRDKQNLNVDVYLYDPISSSKGFHNIAADTSNAILSDDFKVNFNRKNKKYKICIAPYSNMINLDCQYRLGYCYGAATTKPRFTLNPSSKNGFHGLFLHDIYGAELFSIYGKTYIVPDLYLSPIKQKKIHKIPSILFLPTYHESSSVQTAMELAKLKKEFHIITKLHHGTENLEEEQYKHNLIKKIADETFPSAYPISKLFEKCDVVLSDNSGAVMDALYANIPISIAAPDINQSLADIDTIQYVLATQNIIPYTANLNSTALRQIINSALSPKQQKIQKEASRIIFPVKNGGPNYWYQIIKKYLNDDIEQNYCKIHDYVFSKYNQLEKENWQLQQKVANLEASLQITQSALNKYKNSRAHQFIDKLQNKVYKSE